MANEDRSTLGMHGRFGLPFKAALLRCLDADQRPLAAGTGFVTREEGELYLYTCWHLVTGYNPNQLRVLQPPNRRYLEVRLQGVSKPQNGMTVIGGVQSHVLPLYGNETPSPLPRWLQEDTHRPNGDLNEIGVFVPFFFDTVKIKLPEDIEVSDLQLIDRGDFYFQPVEPGDKVFIVGFPYGFSALGDEQPTGVVLTRFVAATSVAGRPAQILLDGGGANAMSGGPVFTERDNNAGAKELKLLGLYTGVIFPDYPRDDPDRISALGTCCPLAIAWTPTDPPWWSLRPAEVAT